MVVLAASICTRGGKAVLSRQFREMQRSRVEALLASFPKLADAGTQHTTVEQDNVRYVYQPLDELYMVLITNKQSNILQDIDSLHLFAQTVSSICKSLDEREILRNAFELLSAFDEIVNLGYRENLTIAQIKTFLEMESHEERVAMIIETNKQLEANEQRKMRAKQIEMQRREQTRAGRTQMPRAPAYSSYTPPVSTSIADTIDTYTAEKNRSLKPSAPLGKGMQLGKKSKTTNMFDQVRNDFGGDEEPTSSTPLAGVPTPTSPSSRAPAATAARTSLSGDREAIHITVAETIAARLTRDGAMESFEVKGDLQLKISDPSMTQVKLNLAVNDKHGVQFTSHPKVDRQLFTSSRVVQLRDVSRGFPTNNSIGVVRWRHTAGSGASVDLPLLITAWVNEGANDMYSVTVEYELGGGAGADALRDVVISIPFAQGEPNVSSFDATYQVSGDSIDWSVGNIDPDTNPSGSFEFEAEAADDSTFFPMGVRFSKTRPYVDVDVASVSLLNMDQSLPFSKDVKSHASTDSYVVA